MYKVAIIGPESTGKSVLARYLAHRYKGTYVPEYARTYVEQKGSTEVSYDELCDIARHQIKELEDINQRLTTNDQRLTTNDQRLTTNDQRLTTNDQRLYFFDTELIVTKVWFDYAFGRVPEWLNESIHRYPMDVYLLTYPDLPWIPDPARSNGSDAIRLELFHRYESEIQSLNIPYYIIRHEG